MNLDFLWLEPMIDVLKLCYMDIFKIPIHS